MNYAAVDIRIPILTCLEEYFLEDIDRKRIRQAEWRRRLGLTGGAKFPPPTASVPTGLPHLRLHIVILWFVRHDQHKQTTVLFEIGIWMISEIELVD